MIEYVSQFKSYRSQILDRKNAVEEMMHELDAVGCDCKERPNAPCCLLNTEHDLLVKLVDVLDRELWHLEHKND